MHLFLAPAGYGKTAHVIEKIRAARPTGSLDPIWVILPNQEQVRTFRQRLALAGGALGVEIDTFYGVYAKVLALSGEPMPRLFDTVQHRLLRGVVDALCDEGALVHYAPLRDKPGFMRRLRDLILELKQARIEPEDFASAMAGEPARLTELAAIYQRYQAWLQDTGWADAEGQGWLAKIELEDNPTLGTDICLLAVDGFDEFNPTQLIVLRMLAQRASQTIVTLTGEVDGPARDAYRRFTRARNDLSAACADIELKALPAQSTKLDATLAYLESSIFNPSSSLSRPSPLAPRPSPLAYPSSKPAPAPKKPAPPCAGSRRASSVMASPRTKALSSPATWNPTAPISPKSPPSMA